MTMGPEPMIMALLMSVRLGISETGSRGKQPLSRIAGCAASLAWDGGDGGPERGTNHQWQRCPRDLTGRMPVWQCGCSFHTA
jgi:hypothetical protein